MSKKVVEVKEKKAHVAKPKTPNFSMFTNLNPNTNASTQTVSNKKLLKPILHSVGLTLGKSNPVAHNTHNEAQFNKLLKKEGKTKLQYYMNEQPFMQYVTKQTIL